MISPLLPFGLKPNNANEADAGPYYADIQSRGLAATIDVLILFTLFQRPFDLLTVRVYADVDHELLAKARAATDSATILDFLWQSHLPQLWLVNSMIQIVILGTLIIGLQCWLRTTPGKWLLGLRIVRADNLEAPARWQYVIRFLAYIPACLPLMLGIFWMSFNKRRRGWHDMMAGTSVVHTHPRGWVWQQVKRGFRWVHAKLVQKKQ